MLREPVAQHEVSGRQVRTLMCTTTRLSTHHHQADHDDDPSAIIIHQPARHHLQLQGTATHPTQPSRPATGGAPQRSVPAPVAPPATPHVLLLPPLHQPTRPCSPAATPPRVERRIRASTPHQRLHRPAWKHAPPRPAGACPPLPSMMCYIRHSMPFDTRAPTRIARATPSTHQSHQLASGLHRRPVVRPPLPDAPHAPHPRAHPPPHRLPRRHRSHQNSRRGCGKPSSNEWQQHAHPCAAR